jgi:uncharacterized protein
LSSTLNLAVFGIVTAAGLIRGTTGFGGTMFMAPLLSLLLGPAATVVIALALETAAAITTLPAAWGKVQWKIIGFLALPSLATVPLGCYLLSTLDAPLMRRLMAGTVVLFSVAMLAGFRYGGRPRPATSIALGGLAGVLLGATSVGAPPVILYLLSGPDSHVVTRANLIFFITTVSAAGLVALWANGLITSQIVVSAVELTIPYLAGTWAGGKLFSRLSDLGFRRVALVLMLVTGAVTFVL